MEIDRPTDSASDEYDKYSPDEPLHPAFDIKEVVFLDLWMRLCFFDFFTKGSDAFRLLFLGLFNAIFDFSDTFAKNDSDIC